ncbi:MAG: Hsp20/alpha crystallin family protein [Candidatus Woesearchaeota archaeon]
MYFDPFDEIARMHEEIDRMFQRAFRPGQLLENRPGQQVQVRMPVSFLEEKNDSVTARFELPGIDKKDMELNVTKDYIEVKAESKQEKHSKEKSRESHYSTVQQFYRRLALHAEIDPGKSVAEYKNGLLTVEIPKIKRVHEPKKQVQIR